MRINKRRTKYQIKQIIIAALMPASQEISPSNRWLVCWSFCWKSWAFKLYRTEEREEHWIWRMSRYTRLTNRVATFNWNVSYIRCCTHLAMFILSVLYVHEWRLYRTLDGVCCVTSKSPRLSLHLTLSWSIIDICWRRHCCYPSKLSIL